MRAAPLTSSFSCSFLLEEKTICSPLLMSMVPSGAKRLLWCQSPHSLWPSGSRGAHSSTDSVQQRSFQEPAATRRVAGLKWLWDAVVTPLLLHTYSTLLSSELLLNLQLHFVNTHTSLPGPYPPWVSGWYLFCLPQNLQCPAHLNTCGWALEEDITWGTITLCSWKRRLNIIKMQLFPTVLQSGCSSS